MILSALNPIMPTEIGKQVFNAFPNTTTSMSAFGGAVTINATAATPAPSAQASWASKPRTSFSAAAGVSGFYKTVPTGLRSSTPGEGGFMFHIRFCLQSIASADPFFFGLSPASAMPSDVMQMTNAIGICAYYGQDNTSNLQLYACGAATANQSVTDLGAGANRSAYANSTWDFYAYSPVDKLTSNGGDVYWMFMRDGIYLVAEGVIAAASASNIAVDAFVGPAAQINTTNSGATSVIAVMEAYMETY